MSALARVTAAAFRPVDAASLAFFRIAFGLLMCADAIRKLLGGWIETEYIQPRLHFKYLGFEWVQVWPGNGIYLHYVAMAVCAFLLALGLFTRVFAFLFFVLFSYVFLLDQMYYLNHYYLIVLISFLLVFVPSERTLSLDARRKGWKDQTIPAWALWLIRAQIAIPYVFGGIAKIEGDWLSGVPMYILLSQGPPFGVEMSEMPYVPLLFAWAGMFFDLLVVPAIFWRRTRVFALLAALAFNAFNHWLFQIGVFPFLMLGATTMFLPPSWPRRLLRFLGPEPAPADAPGREAGGRRTQRFVVAAVGLYLLVQLLVPFREHLYPGNSDWTEEGHVFSWKMKLRTKIAKAMLVVKDPSTGEMGPVEPDGFFRLYEARRMASRPELLLQFAHYMRDEFKKRGKEVEIYGRSLVSLNGRAPADLIDQTVDLCKVDRGLGPASWVLPLREERPSLEALQAAKAKMAVPELQSVTGANAH